MRISKQQVLKVLKVSDLASKQWPAYMHTSKHGERIILAVITILWVLLRHGFWHDFMGV